MQFDPSSLLKYAIYASLGILSEKTDHSVQLCKLIEYLQGQNTDLRFGTMTPGKNHASHI